MNENNYIGIATEEILRWFGLLNDKYYSSKLETPVITIQKSSRGMGGWFTVDKVWSDKDETVSKYEINICAEQLKNEVEKIVEILLHEMTHYSNKVNDIKDCSGVKHNKKFKEAAEAVELIVEQPDKYGFGHTSCSDALINYIKTTIKPDANAFKYFRTVPETKEKKEKASFTYECPSCGEKVHAKRDKKIICGECKCDFVMNE